jgi:diguanylate cyclase (GGDEF)-like protein/PAS domain S-box-containing protein
VAEVKVNRTWTTGILVAVMVATVSSGALGYGVAHGVPSLAVVLLGLVTRQSWQLFILAVLATILIFIDPNFEHGLGPRDVFEHGLAVASVWVAAFLIHRILQRDRREVATNQSQLQVLDAALDGIISIDESGRVNYINTSAAEMFGVEKGDIWGCDLAEVIIPERYRTAHREGLKRAREENLELSTRRFELPASRPDGSEFPIELTITENRHSQQRFTAFIRDLTESRRMATEMTMARDEAIAANNIKARFLGNISRELRAPLTTILGYAELTLNETRDQVGERAAEYLSNIQGAGEALRESVDRLLAISHASSLANEMSSDQKHLFDLTPDMICICHDGRVASINQAGVELIGAESTEAIIGRLITDFVDRDDHRYFEAGPATDSRERVRFPVRLACLNGESREVDVFEQGIEFEGRPATLIVGRDITIEMSSKREMNRQRKLLKILHETAVIANNASNSQEAISEALSTVCAETDWPVGHAYMVTTDGSDVLESSRIWHFREAARYQELRRVTEASSFSRGQGLPGRVMAAGRPMWIADIRNDPNFPRATLLKDTEIKAAFGFPMLTGAKVVGVLEFFSPNDKQPDEVLFNALNQIGTQLGRVIERENAEAQMIRQANFDPLTDLPNRALVTDRLTQALRMVERDKQTVIVISVDLDDFKKVNDTLGHAAGDQIIVEAAGRVKSVLRKSDTVASLGGDEFLVVVKEFTNGERAAKVAEKLMSALRNPFPVGDTQVFVSASLGIAVFPGDGDDAQTLMRNAGVAMYSAKTAGRDTYQFFSPEMNANSHRLLTVDTNLRYALAAGELYSVYQPIVDTITGHPVALETLLRWENPELGFVPPDQFISIAENSGEILRIGSWLIQRATQDLLTLKRQGFPDLRIAINISPKQFIRGGILNDVRQALQRTGLSSHDLELEVTEGLLMTDEPEVNSTLAELHQMGVSLSIDDFGTGYSSLSYLRRYPFDTLKIDKSFVDGLSEGSENAALVAGIISMSHAMRMKVICEGVENRTELAFLERHGGDFIQGYYFGKPMKLGDVGRRLSELTSDDLLFDAVSLK